MPATNPEPSINRELIKKHPGGAPTLYNAVMLDKAKQYANTYSSEEIGHKVPSVAGLAVYLKVTRDTIYRWMKEYSELSDTISMMMAQQEQTLLDNGLTGVFNAHITKLVLSKHGYTENANNNNNITINVSRDGVVISDNNDTITIDNE